jgi:hypothetical protein
MWGSVCLVARLTALGNMDDAKATTDSGIAVFIYVVRRGYGVVGYPTLLLFVSWRGLICGLRGAGVWYERSGMEMWIWEKREWRVRRYVGLCGSVRL